jgi:hypothetical protein
MAVGDGQPRRLRPAAPPRIIHIGESGKKILATDFGVRVWCQIFWRPLKINLDSIRYGPMLAAGD